MSRDDNDALEAAQARARAFDERLEPILARHAGLELQRQRLAGRLATLKRKRNGVRARLDALPGNGLFSVLGFCAAAILARLVWEVRPQLEPDARVLMGAVALATSLVVFLSRTHWYRFGFRR
jgi:hypothetical protein